MCWTTRLKEHQVKRIAANDIQVYKILEKRRTWISGRIKYVSPFYNFKYKLNKVYKSRIELDVQTRNDVLTIEKGLHSFTNFQQAKCCYNIGKLNCEPWFIFKAIIPKGSIYYVNEDREVVSNKLKIIEICG